MEADTVSFGLIAPAIYGQSPKQQPLGSLVLPGAYEVRLIAGGTTLTQKLTVVNDPRSEASAADLTAQFAQEQRLMHGIGNSRFAIDVIGRVRTAARTAVATHSGANAALQALDRAGAAVITTLAGNRGFASILADLEYADMRPAPSVIAAIDTACAKGDQSLARYRDFLEKDLAAFNTALTAAGGTAIAAPQRPVTTACVAR